MQTVQFTQHFDIYNSGEIAGFAPDRATELVAAGVAKFVDLKKPAAKRAAKSEEAE